MVISVYNLYSDNSYENIKENKSEGAKFTLNLGLLIPTPPLFGSDNRFTPFGPGEKYYPLQHGYVRYSAVGYGIGADFTLPIFTKNLKWISTVNVSIVPPSDHARISEFIRAYRYDYETESIELNNDYGNWIHFPISTGLLYDFKVSSNFGIYFMSQISLTTSYLSEGEINVKVNTLDTEDIDILEKHEQRSSVFMGLGYIFGFGFTLFDKYNMSFRYHNYANLESDTEVKLKVTKRGDYGYYYYFEENFDTTLKRSISYIMITFGYRL